nr:single-stranded-DNA-specific exonuclease C-terminal domain-containing protein [Clostridiales bacterium]
LKTIAYGIADSSAFTPYDESELDGLIGGRQNGVLLIAGCEETYRKYCSSLRLDRFLNEFLYFTCINNYSRVIVSPDLGGAMLSGYDTVIFLDTPPAYALAFVVAKKSGGKVYVPQNDNQRVFLDGIDCSREAFGVCFDAIRRNQALTADNVLSYYKLLSARCSLSMNAFMAAVAVFSELGFITVQKSPFKIEVNAGMRAELTDSKIYGYLLQWAKS